MSLQNLSIEELRKKMEKEEEKCTIKVYLLREK